MEVVDGEVLVAGETTCNGNVVEAVVWKLDLSGNLISRNELGALGGSGSRAFGLSGRGDVVGAAREADDTDWHAFLHTNYEDPSSEMIELGSLGNGSSYAAEINDQGVVVGEYENYRGKNSNEPDQYAFVCAKGRCSDFSIMSPITSSGPCLMPATSMRKDKLPGAACWH